MSKTESPNELPYLDRALSEVLSHIDPGIARILDKALGGGQITVEEGATLFESKRSDLTALMVTADELRKRSVGEVVTYVVNRNINFTNVCIKQCGFCAFSRDYRADEGYFLPANEIIRRAREAWELGATEVCVQAGLPPKMDGDLYVDLTKAIKADLPDMHIHGFSPEEVLYGSIRAKESIAQYLARLKDAGVGSLPGTSAEILDQRIRDRIAPGRITVDKWTEVIMTAHRLGIPTTSTIMFGHIESPMDRARHLDYVRSIQVATGGITEFVPLSFVHSEAPMYFRNQMEDLQPGATGADVIRMHAVSRIMLNDHIPNIQCSWVKEGPRMSQLLLSAGCNDLGGTLINESISTSAGANYGQLVVPSELRRWIRDIGRTPAERTTLYDNKKIFAEEPGSPDPLDSLEGDISGRFGSYHELVRIPAYRYEGERAPKLNGPTLPEVLAAGLE